MLDKVLGKPIVRYIVVGGVSYLFELSVLYMLHAGFGFSGTAAVAISFWVGLIASFFLQKIVAFKDYRREKKLIAAQSTAFISLVLFNYSFTLVLISIFPSKYLIFTRTIALIITTFWNYLLYKNLLFANTSKTHISVSRLLSQTHKTLHIFINSTTAKVMFTSLNILLLISATSYGAFQATYTAANNSDALVDTYLLSDSIKDAGIYLQPEHTSLLKFPIFILQGIFPYHYASFVLLNICLGLITVIGSAYLFWRIFNKKYANTIILATTSIIAASTLMSIDTVWSTARNIDFVIALLFITVLSAFVSKTRVIKPKEILGLLVVSLLFGLLLGSDQYFLYVVVAPILLFLIYGLIKKAFVTTRLLYALGAIMLSVVLGYVIPRSAEALGIVSLLSSGSLDQTIIAFDKLPASVWASFGQLLDLCGGLFFGLPINPLNFGLFINFVLVLVVMRGLNPRLIFRSIKRSDESTFIKNTRLIIGYCFVATFLIYVMSDQVLRFGERGYVSNHAERYITFAVLLAVPIFVWWVQMGQKKHSNLFFIVNSVLFIAVLTSMIQAPSRWESIQKSALKERATYLRASEILKKEQVGVFLSGHWYGATTRFWHGDNIEYAPIQACNRKFEVLSRPSWYASNSRLRSALIVDHGGRDKEYWAVCDNSVLQRIYGKPENKIPLTKSVTIWVYPYDARSKVY